MALLSGMPTMQYLAQSTFLVQSVPVHGITLNWFNKWQESVWQMTNNVSSCPQTKLEGGQRQLHLDDDNHCSVVNDTRLIQHMITTYQTECQWLRSTKQHSYQLVVNAEFTDSTSDVGQVKAHDGNRVHISLCVTWQWVIDMAVRRWSVGSYFWSSGHWRCGCWTHTRHYLESK